MHEGRAAAPPQTAEKTTPTAPTSSPLPPVTQPGSTSASGPLDDAIQALLSPPTPPKASVPAPPAGKAGSTSNGPAASSMFEHEPETSLGDSAELGFTPSHVVGLLPASGWKLGSCWGPECGCLAFKSAAPSPSPLRRAAGLTPVCACGHGSCAHELIDANDDAEEASLPPVRHQQRQQYRYYPGDGDSSSVGAVAAASETAVRLRRLFSAIRNARAVGDSGLFEDSEGVRGWGSGWFLSRCVSNSFALRTRPLFQHD